MKCYKYQIREAAGTYGWEYVIVPDWVGLKGEYSLEEYLDYQGVLPSDHEHYRGVNCKRVRKPPKDVLDYEISGFRSKIADDRETLKQLREMKKKFYSKGV